MRVFADADETPTLFKMLVVYATTAYRDLRPSALSRVIKRVRPEWEEDMLSIAARDWMAEGEAKGETRARVAVLTHLLNRKFGELPLSVPRRLEGASVEALDDWCDKVLDAATLDDVFGDNCRQ